MTLSGTNNLPSEYIYWRTVWTNSIERYRQGLLGLNHPCTVTGELQLPVPNDSVHLKQIHFHRQVTSDSAPYCS